MEPDEGTGGTGGTGGTENNAPALDPVNHPPHYTASNSVECIDAIEAALGREGSIAFLRGQVMKYVWRGPLKGAELQDYKKCRWYLDRLINLMEGKP